MVAYAYHQDERQYTTAPVLHLAMVCRRNKMVFQVRYVSTYNYNALLREFLVTCAALPENPRSSESRPVNPKQRNRRKTAR